MSTPPDGDRPPGTSRPTDPPTAELTVPPAGLRHRPTGAGADTDDLGRRGAPDTGDTGVTGTGALPDDSTPSPAPSTAGRWDAVRRRLTPGEVTMPERPAGPARVLFALTAAFYVVYQVATRGQMILSGSMWAEMGANYYSTTTTLPWWQQLVATDAGYIPLPQRLFALTADGIGIPVQTIPYVYTGGAVVLSGLILGALCLPAFRPVIGSDLLRAGLVLALMLVPDFETRTFINFTYFAVVLAVSVTALAAVDRSREVPAWAWVLPVLIISKPGVLAVVPAMVVVSVLSRRRFTMITAVSVVAAVIQVARLATSSAGGGSLLQTSDATTSDKLVASIKYTFGFLGRLVLGPGTTLSAAQWILAGVVVALVASAAAVVLRGRAGVLVPIGMSLVAFTMIVNCFSFSAAFSRDMAILSIGSLDRRFIVAVIGVFYVVAGLVAAVMESPRWRHLPQFGSTSNRPRWVGTATVAAGAAVFAGWFAVSGWLQYVTMVNQPRALPSAEVSQWDEQAPLLASGEPVVCVPLDPFGWLYGRNCIVLDDANVTPVVWGWAPLPAAPDEAEAESQPADGTGPSTGADLTVEAPDPVRDGAVASVALMVRPPGGVERITGTATLTSADGSTRVLRADTTILPGGGLVQFDQSPVVPMEDVVTVTFSFQAEVSVGADAPADPATAILLWMGLPG